MRIQELSPDVIALIAAGEVIERPAYIVKELIDNAIDAQATSIIIDISQSGLKRISVQDNGIGMSEDDLSHAAKLHTTSKISSVDDLQTIRTFGFRGEALASIAAISDLAIFSRETDAPIGSVYHAADRTIQPAGMPHGTRVVVENVFHTVPGRQKFLKSPQTERRFIIDIFCNYALSHPAIHFSLRHNTKVLFDLPKSSLLERYMMLFGGSNSADLLPIQFEDSYLHLSGFVAKPNRVFSSTKEQYIFVNKRPVSDRIVSSAIKEAFGTLIPRDLFPSGVFFLDIPIQLIDVNVHPRKEQVQFVSPTELHMLVRLAIHQTLEKHNLTFQAETWDIFSKNRMGSKKSITHSFAASELKSEVLGTPQTTTSIDFQSIQQWHKTYISVQTTDGLLFFDQHAVHERILYENFLQSFHRKQKESKSVKLQEEVQLLLSPSDALIFDEHFRLFEQMGFQFLSKMRTIITHVPALFVDRDPRPIFDEYLSQIRGESGMHTVDALSKKMMTYLACRSAVKAGDSLTKEEMQNLIETLFKTKNKYTCPHGRPTMIAISKKSFDSLFMRI